MGHSRAVAHWRITWRNIFPAARDSLRLASEEMIWIYTMKHHWLVVEPPLWTILVDWDDYRWLYPIYGKIKHVPNHQPVIHWNHQFPKLPCSITRGIHISHQGSIGSTEFKKTCLLRCWKTLLFIRCFLMLYTATLWQWHAKTLVAHCSNDYPLVICIYTYT